MKQPILKATLILIFLMAILWPAKAQMIYKMSNNRNFYIPASSVTHNYNIYSQAMWNVNGYKNIENNVAHNIKSKNTTYYKYLKKGEKQIERSKSIEIYDKNGQIVNRKRYNNAKEVSFQLFEYNKNKAFTDFKSYKKGKYKTHELLKYDDNNNVLEYYSYKGDKFKSKWIANYNDSLILAQWSYKKDTNEIRSKWEYNYYKNNEKKTTKYYKNTKLKHTWNYTCDKEGKEVKAKDETNVCELKQYNNDSTYVVITRRTGKKGKVSKHRSTYDKKDRLILSESFNTKEQITSKYAYAYNDNDKQTAYYTYYRGKRSEKVKWGRESKFNDKSELVESRRIWRNKLKTISTYKYENGKKVESVSKKPDGSLKFKKEYLYNDKGLLTATLYYNEDGLLKYKSIIEFQYF